MYSLVLIYFLCLNYFDSSEFRLKSKDANPPKDALFLTPYIEAQNSIGAQEAAKVKPFAGDIKSYSGFLTVNKTFNSNLFIWFFPQNSTKWENSTTILWLQGGPAGSSIFGIFEEHGPYVFKNGTLKERHYSWTSDFNLLYIDNPVGAGFSFTNSQTHGYSKNQNDIAENLYEAIRQFFLLFPNLRNNKFIIAGESLGGKYSISLAKKIHFENSKTAIQKKINLYGIFIGNPLLCVEYMLHYGEYFYSIGLLDKEGKKIFETHETKLKFLIKSSNWTEATNTFLDIFYTNSIFQNLTGLKQHCNFLKENQDIYPYISFLKKTETKSQIHVGSYNFDNFGRIVYENLWDDLMKCVKTDLEFLLTNYKILIYAGQLDIICPYYLIENILHNLEWNESVDYHLEPRRIFKVDQYIAGYYRQIGNLSEVLIRNAGHMAPKEKPQWIRVLLRRFEKNQL